MKHLNGASVIGKISEDFIIRATGRFYTHEAVANHLISSCIKFLSIKFNVGDEIHVIDPFAGDGRLLFHLLSQWSLQRLPHLKWHINLWDINKEGLEKAKYQMQVLKKSGINFTIQTMVGDSFNYALKNRYRFDVILTNPPWELLKPDSRELKNFSSKQKDDYISNLREYDAFLSTNYPDSQPTKKFAGWGTNLSRVGLDVCRYICKQEGLIGIVIPASFLADDQSIRLRSFMLSENTLHDISYFPAEAKLYGKADVASCTLLFKAKTSQQINPLLTIYNKCLSVLHTENLPIPKTFLDKIGYILPVSMGHKTLGVLFRLAKNFPTWSSLENSGNEFWAGREIDETGSIKWLRETGSGPFFLKGRMIDRFTWQREQLHVEKQGLKIPDSVNFERIVWRDVSRPNQKRRLIATLIPSNYICGNSLGVAHFKDGNPVALRALLGVMNSLCFEFQLRSHLATGHVSLSALRKVHIPEMKGLITAHNLVEAVNRALSGNAEAEIEIEALVAKEFYKLNREEYELILEAFPKLTKAERDKILDRYYRLSCEKRSARNNNNLIPKKQTRIPNHLSATLSELDMRMVLSVPQGGNWKNIPDTIPSNRILKIRNDYKEGFGSRSTYYGRLRPEMPSYTINTYFNRPGNGCHIHYDQNRVISQREAARLQSFPDSFVFIGSQGSVNKQIGNAVPPLLAYQIAKCLGKPGLFVDLFSGAGGLGLGFAWAGWDSVVANDIEPLFLETYARNVDNRVVLGSITDEDVFEKIVDIAETAKRERPDVPFWVLGGPPCQGFSTGGWRNAEDERNKLFLDYKKFLEKIKPDGFIFENVTGLLNMKGGMVFKAVKDAFKCVMPGLFGSVLSSEEYGIPQRRKRVILAGTKDEDSKVAMPDIITSCNSEHAPNLFVKNIRPAISVFEALSDLPPLKPGEDGTLLDYISPPKTAYQKFMRGIIDADKYLEIIKNGMV